VELKRQAPEASKALGAEVVFEFINANDLQPRITAAIQSGSGPDIIHMLHNWPHLYENGLVEVNDLAEWQAKDQGGFYAQSEAYVRVAVASWPCPTASFPAHRVPEVVAHRGRRTTFPRPTRSCARWPRSSRSQGHPYGQTLGHTFGDAPAWAYPLLWNSAGWRPTKAARRRSTAGHGGGRQVHDRVLEGRSATRAGWPGTIPTTTAPSSAAKSAPR